MPNIIKIRVPVLVFPPEGKLDGLYKQMHGAGEKAIAYEITVDQGGIAHNLFNALERDLATNPNARLYYLTAELEVPESRVMEAEVEDGGAT